MSFITAKDTSSFLSHPPLTLEDRLKARALEFGFDHAALSPAFIPERDQKAYLAWCEQGLAGDMAYMTRDPAKRAHLSSILPSTVTALTLGVSYYQGDLPPKPGPGYGRVARYAWGLDYHSILTDRLASFLRTLADILGPGFSAAHAVDTKPILERALAQSASLGFMGKNTLIIVPRSASSFGFHMGSWVLLAEVLFDLPLENSVGPPAALGGCGGCTRCLTACPTGAFVGPYRLDARRCLSYLTIENKGWIPPDMRPALGDWIFGCDVCQDVCPFNARAYETRWPEFRPDRGTGPWLSLADVLATKDAAAFKARWGHTPLSRAKRKGVIRNACVVAGNGGDGELIPLLTDLLKDPESLIRGHALWALSRLCRPVEGRDRIALHLAGEKDPMVRAEAERLLAE